MCRTTSSRDDGEGVQGQWSWDWTEIEKLLSINPRSPQGLAALGDIALQEGKTQEAQSILARLQSIHPSSQSARDLAALINAYGPGKQQLAQMRLMARAGRKAEAAAIARQLFPAGPPQTGSLKGIIWQPCSTSNAAHAATTRSPARLASSLLRTGRHVIRTEL